MVLEICLTVIHVIIHVMIHAIPVIVTPCRHVTPTINNSDGDDDEKKSVNDKLYSL